MSDDRIREISVEPLGTVDSEGRPEFLVTKLRYDRGGSNFVSGSADPRGYYVTVRVESRVGTVRSFALGSGRQYLVAPAARFSPKGLAGVSVPEDIVARMRAVVLAEKLAAVARARARVEAGA